MNENSNFLSSFNLHPTFLPNLDEASYASADDDFLKDTIIKIEETEGIINTNNRTEHYDILNSEEFMNTPFFFLDLFLNSDLINWFLQVINETSKDPKSSIITGREIKCFISVIYLSGYLNIPRRRLLWERSPDCHNTLVSNAIQRDRFDHIFGKLCCVPVKEENGLNSKVCDFNIIVNNILSFHCPVDSHFSISQVPVNSNKGINAWCGTNQYGYCNFFAFDDNDFCKIVKNYAQKLRQHNVPNLELHLSNKDATPELLHDLNLMNINVINTSRNTKSFHLTGIEKLQCGLELYRSKIGGKSNFLQYLTFCLDIFVHNAYLLYKNKQKEDKKLLDMLGFRRNIVVYYLESHGKPILNRKVSKTGMSRKRKISCESRFDGIMHYVIPQEKQTRCGECSQKTKTRCQKCDIGVHVKCFVNFHTRSKT